MLYPSCERKCKPPLDKQYKPLSSLTTIYNAGLGDLLRFPSFSGTLNKLQPDVGGLLVPEGQAL